MVKHTIAALVVVAMGSSVWAQAAVTAAEVTRLEVTAGDIERHLGDLRKTDPALATVVEKSLADLRDDVVYLKVKLRKDGTVPRPEFSDIRDRLESLRVKSGTPQTTQGAAVTAMPVLDEPSARMLTVPAGTGLDVRLQTPLSSGTSKVEERFEATTILDLKSGTTLLIPAGTLVRGFVSSVRAAGKVERKGSLTLSFDDIVVGKDHARLRASVTLVIDGKMSEDTTRRDAGVPVTAMSGMLGPQGAMVGVTVIGGGTISSTEGSNVDLPLGTILRIRADQPFAVAAGKIQ